MTPAELIAFGTVRHGELWCGPLSAELGFHFSTVWRAAFQNPDKPVSRELEQAIRLLPKKPKKQGSKP
jgi:hypothetical protein